MASSTTEATPSRLLTETLVGLGNAARRFPGHRRNERISVSTIWRWITTGVPAPGGGRVHLESARLGGRWLTSLEALQRFSEALTPTTAEQPPPSRSPAARQRANDHAAKRLKELGC